MPQAARCLAWLLFGVALSEFPRDDTEEINWLACAAQLFHDTPKLLDTLEEYATAVQQHSRAASSLTRPKDVEKLSFCLHLCSVKPEPTPEGIQWTPEDFVPSEEWLERAKVAKRKYWYRSNRCVAEWAHLVEIEPEPVDTLPARMQEALDLCGVCRILGFFSSPVARKWLSEADEVVSKMSMGPAGMPRARTEDGSTGERITHDVLLSADRELWLSGVGDALTSPSLIAGVGRYFSVSDPTNASAPRLSYASWIIAPPPPLLNQTIHGDVTSHHGMVSMQIALHDFDQALGPTAYCPATHDTGAEPTLHTLVRESILLRSQKLKNESFCDAVVPAWTPQGTVNIYDSALLHYGTPNHGDRARILLNANLAKGRDAMLEEQYDMHFVWEPNVQNELSWMRQILDESLFRSILNASTCENRDDTAMSNADGCNMWSARRVALQRRLDMIPLPNLGWVSWLAYYIHRYLGVGMRRHDEN